MSQTPMNSISMVRPPAIRLKCQASSNPELSCDPSAPPASELDFLVGRERISGEVDLVRRQQPHHVNEGGEHAHDIGAPAEAEQPDPVALLPSLAQEAIGGERILIQSGAGGETQHAAGLLLEASPGVLQADGADARMIIDPLLVALFEHAIKLEDVRDGGGDLVAGAVAANDDILRHRCPPISR